MWGRRQPAESNGSSIDTSKSTNVPRALATTNELLRRADWERLSDADRANLRRTFAPFPAASTDAAIQDWVAALVAPDLQADSAQLIRAWLDEAAPDAHLFVGGGTGTGRRSLAASLARQAMSRQPTPPEFCYVPEPSAMDRAYLLTLPTGTGDPFAKAMDNALQMLTGAWDSVVNSDKSESESQPSPSASSVPEPHPSLPQLVAQAFAPLEQPGFAAVSAYVARLRTAFDALASSGTDLPVTYDAMPTWLVRAPSGDGPTTANGAPVVIGTLLRDKIDDLLTRANGGVLILPAADFLSVDGSWLTLSVALSTRALQVKSSWPSLPLSVRVVLIGDNSNYTALSSALGEFNRLFRYETWLRSAVSWTQGAEAVYAALADAVAQRNILLTFDPSGVARLIEEGARRGDGLNRSYVSADLVLLSDLAREAAQAARSRGASATSGSDVTAALQRRRTLQMANARRVREAILSGQAITPTAGAAIGQINGLGIYEFHPDEGTFAVPTRISATVSPGVDERVLDIEREADQADADHVRGEMTVEGYLANHFGQAKPINLVARIRFEQEHGTTVGDSASGAILFALLSALAQVPIRFSYAVTGAVGQYGELQPIGGVNTKIEGFWELCRQRRAEGEQVEGGYGVLIPTVNARDLMLRDEVAESITREGWFNVWPITTVDEALAILTGLHATDIAARVEQRLQRFHEIGMQARGGR